MICNFDIIKVDLKTFIFNVESHKGPTGCPTNEVYAACKACIAETCDDGVKDVKKKPNCKPPAQCQAGCICKPGFFRSPYAFFQCIPLRQCPGYVKTDSDDGEDNRR